MRRRSSLNTLSSLFIYLFFFTLILGFTINFYYEKVAWQQGLLGVREDVAHEEMGLYGNTRREAFHEGEVFEYEVLSKAYRRHLTFEVLSRLEDGYLIGSRMETERLMFGPYSTGAGRITRVLEDRFAVDWEGRPQSRTLSSYFWRPVPPCRQGGEGEVPLYEREADPGEGVVEVEETWGAWVCAVAGEDGPIGELWSEKGRGLLLFYQGIFPHTGEGVSMVLLSHQAVGKHHLLNFTIGNVTVRITK